MSQKLARRPLGDLTNLSDRLIGGQYMKSCAGFESKSNYDLFTDELGLTLCRVVESENLVIRNEEIDVIDDEINDDFDDETISSLNDTITTNTTQNEILNESESRINNQKDNTKHDWNLNVPQNYEPEKFVSIKSFFCEIQFVCLIYYL